MLEYNMEISIVCAELYVSLCMLFRALEYLIYNREYGIEKKESNEELYENNEIISIVPFENV